MATEKQTSYIEQLKSAEIKSAYGFPQIQQILKAWKDQNGIDWDTYDEVEDNFARLNAPQKTAILNDYHNFISSLQIPDSTAEASLMIDDFKSGQMTAKFAATIDPRSY
jgi:hypothetical protein